MAPTRNDGMFRKVSLEHLSSPEQLDDVMRVTTPTGWLALATLGVLTASGLALSVVGTAPEKVSAKGIVISPGGVVDVISATQGLVIRFLSGPGDWVGEGRIVANVAQPEIEAELKEAEAELIQARSRGDSFSRFQERDFALQRDAMASAREQLGQQKVFLAERLRWQVEREGIEAGLLKKGLTETRRVIDSRMAINATKETYADTEKSIKQLSLDEEKLILKRDMNANEQKENIASLDRRVEKITERLRRNINIISPYSGYITEFKVNAGEVVDHGRVLFSMLPQSRPAKDGQFGRGHDDLVVKIYVKPADGKKIAVGMAAQVSPSTVKREEYGFMAGRVIGVAPIPSTEEGIQRMLKNRQLVQELTGGGAPFEVTVGLDLDAASHSGYKWSSSAGPWVEINPGTLAEASITIREIHLISLLIPAFEQMFERHSP
jgi:HlyD family secretion protein